MWHCMDVFYRLVNETHFEPVNRPTKYGASSIQPSVGDAGAPVFTFIGNHWLDSLFLD